MDSPHVQRGQGDGGGGQAVTGQGGGADPMIVSLDGQRAADIAASSGSCAMQELIDRLCGERDWSGGKRW